MKTTSTMKHRLGVFLRVGSILALLGPATAFGQSQGYLLSQLSPGSVGANNAPVAVVGLVDADSVPDIIVGEPAFSPPGLPGAGRVRVFSGATGAVLYSINGSAANEYFGSRVASAGFVNGDGSSDFIVGAPSFGGGLGRAAVYSGADGSVLFNITGAAAPFFGSSLAGLGDVNADSFGDFAVGTNAPFGPGSVQVFSGATGSLLYSLSGAANQNFGVSIACAGYVDGDGVADILVGAPVNFGSALGQASVYSGATGAILYTLTSPTVGNNFGRAVAGAGDVDGDGRDDLIVAARDETVGTMNQAGRVRVYSGATGALLYVLNGQAAVSRFGNSVAGAGDIDGDGFSDFLASSAGPAGNAAVLRVFSGQTGMELFGVNATAGGYFPAFVASGWSIDALGSDFNQDGFNDIVAGDFAAGIVNTYSYVGVPTGSSLLGVGCNGGGGAVPTIAVSGGALNGAMGNPNARVWTSLAPAGFPAILIVGASDMSWAGASLPLNLGAFGFSPTCNLYVSIDLLYPATTNAGGKAFVSLQLPSGVPTGTQLFLQELLPGAAPVATAALSQKLAIVIQ